MALAMPVYTILNRAQASEDSELLKAAPCHQPDAALDGEFDGKPSCSHCVLCQIAGGTVPTAPIVLAATGSRASLHAAAEERFVSFCPPLPQRPPSRAET